MRISDWSSGVCSSDLAHVSLAGTAGILLHAGQDPAAQTRALTVLTAETSSPNGRLTPAASPISLDEIGRAWGRGRVSPDVSISVVAGSLKKKTIQPAIIVPIIQKHNIHEHNKN